MIAKDLDQFQSNDRFELAGHKAEKQMAYYLARAFKNDERFDVFNGLRLIHDGDVAQIDHLVLHRHGMVIIESKSVATEVRVGGDGAWIRVYNRSESGMRSPVIQAQMQADLLRDLLHTHAGELFRRPILGLRADPTPDLPIDLLVAISDGGVLHRAPGVAPEASKADQIPERILQIYERHRKAFSSFLSLSLDPPPRFGDHTLTRLREFLLERHTPQQVKPSEQPDGPSQIPANQPAGLKTSSPVRQGNTALVCSKCSGTDLVVAYKYNYFLRCRTCKNAMPLVLTCGRCANPRKDIKRNDVFGDRGALFTKCECCADPMPIGPV